MIPINLHIKNTPNIGDSVCGAGLYYDLGPVEDLSKNLSKGDLKRPVIYGGGAVSSRAVRNARIQSGPTVLWSGGHTVRGKTEHGVLPDYRAIDLAGVRDYGTWKNWVPCVSCKSDLFDKEYAVEHKRVYYGHKKLKPLEGKPYLDNEHRSFEEVISLLGSGETVVTSSYHGVYWAMLLGKNVEVHAFGSKFHYFKYEPGKQPSDFLQECRDANDAFYIKVMELIR